jgi:phosphatidylinositol-3-phosphatase
MLIISVGASTIVQTRLPATGCIGTSCRPFDYIVTILMENNGLCDILTTTLGGWAGNGTGVYMTSLAAANGLATHYTAITHPSEPNYMALAGGDTFVSGDGNCCFQVSAPNIIDRIEASGRTWNAFAEDASGSGTCNFMPPRAADHFPFLEFSDMNKTSRCANFLTTSSPNDPEFINVLNGSNPPNFLWLTPNDTDNMHSSSVSVGDSYLANLGPKILGSKTFATKNAALFIVFDEGSDSCPSAPAGDCVYATWAGPAAKHAFSSNAQYNHYSFLKTLETVWTLPSLTTNDAGATAMTEFFVS